eukprot:Lankesteria_metandrocarpae@DN6610_c0_g1_i1.p1
MVKTNLESHLRWFTSNVRTDPYTVHGFACSAELWKQPQAAAEFTGSISTTAHDTVRVLKAVAANKPHLPVGCNVPVPVQQRNTGATQYNNTGATQYNNTGAT